MASTASRASASASPSRASQPSRSSASGRVSARVTPRSVRRALARAADLRDYARELYVEGTLVFVGFRFGDPDLSALLDRVFGMFEPPQNAHYFLGAGMGPVTVDELMAEHHIEVVNLAGKSGDDVAVSCTGKNSTAVTPSAASSAARAAAPA